MKPSPVQSTLSTRLRLATEAIPTGVLERVSEIERAGGAAWLVGPALPALLSATAPGHWEIQTLLPPEILTALYPAAVITASQQRRLTLASPHGPIDLVTLANRDALLTQLASRRFTSWALAYRPSTGEWIDPHGGGRDALAGRISIVGPAGPRLLADPLAGLRAVQLAATQGLELDSELEEGLCKAAESISFCKPFLIRQELVALLAAPRPGTALRRLQKSGIEAVLIPGARPGSAALIDRLPASLPLRLTAWLRDAPADSILARLRFGRDLLVSVLRRLRYHPLDVSAIGPGSERVLEKLADDELEDLIRLRQAELELESSQPVLDAFAHLTVELREKQHRRTARPPELALDGSTVMAQLGCDAGPRVGQALRFLAECVRRDPTCNHVAGLTERLKQWSKENPD